MTSDIECPVCDRKVSATADRCPNCGAALTMATFEDLEQLAMEIAAGAYQPAKAPAPQRPTPEGKVQAPPTPKAPPPGKEAPKPEAEGKAKPEATPQERPSKEEKEKEPEAAPAGEKAEEEGKKGLGRLFGRRKK